MQLYRIRRAAWYLLPLITLLFSHSAVAQSSLTVEISNPDFLEDYADGIVTDSQLALNLAFAGGGEEIQYRYKFGRMPQFCNFNFGRWRYSSWRDAEQTIDISPDSSFLPSQLCIEARSGNQRASISYKWSTQGTRLSMIIAPESPSITPTPVVRWSEVNEVVDYRLDIASDKNCVNPVQSYAELSDNKQILAPLADGTYYACLSYRYLDRRDNIRTRSAINSPYSWVQAAGDAPGAFEVVGPTSPSNSSTPTVEWTPASGVESYEVIVSADPNCGVAIQTHSNLTSTSQVLDELSDGTYYACVTASNLVGATSATNQPYAWTQLTQVPGDFEITGPTDPSTISDPIVSWSAASGADYYNLIVASDAGCANPVQSFANLSQTSQQLTGLSDGVYFVCLSAVNTLGEKAALNNGYAWDQVTSAPDNFVITAPSGAVDTATPEIAWEAAFRADSYDVTIASDASCANAVTTQLGVTGESVTSAALSEGSYFVCITAQNPAGSTVASNNGLAFVYDVTPPAAFAIVAPSTTVETSDAIIEWQAAQDAESYNLIVSVTSDCADNFISAPGLTTTSLAINGLSDGTFYVCAEAVDNYGNVRTASNNPYAITVQLPVVEPHIMFVTSEVMIPFPNEPFPPTLPYFAGAHQADYLCTASAHAGGYLPEWDYQEVIWHAVIATDTEEAIQRIGGLRTSIVNTNGDVVALNEAELYQQLQNPIQYDENGMAITFLHDVWTGSNADGSVSGANCNNWTDFAASGTTGDPRAIGGTWLNQGAKSCSSYARLYCISP